MNPSSEGAVSLAPTSREIRLRHLLATLLAVAIPMATLALAVGIFAPAQSVWVDESTQLSGSGLGWITLLKWLAGAEIVPLGVPPDRMPPLSYVLDASGWRLWGTNVLAFRLFHATLAAGGMIVLILAVARRWGARQAAVAGLILVLAPKIVTIAVEIRAYPVFLAISCLQTAMIVRGDVAERTGRIGLFLALAVASAYTHFFGIVSASAFFVAIACSASDHRALGRVAGAYALLIVLCLGLVPFVTGARAVSDQASGSVLSLSSLVSFPGQLIGNSELLVWPVMALVYLGSFAASLAILALDLTMQSRRDGLALRRDPRVTLALALVAGIAACLTAALVLKGFNPLNPRYGIWTFPPLAVLAAVSLVPSQDNGAKLSAAVRMAVLALLAVGAIWSHLFLLRHPALFAHGPNQDLERVIAGAEGPIAVVHVGPAWGWGYFPLRWRHGEALPQWLLDPSGQQIVRIGSGGNISGKAAPVATLRRYRTVVYASIESNDYRGLRTLVDDQDIAARAAAARAALPPPLPGHRTVREAFVPGAYALAVREDQLAVR